MERDRSRHKAKKVMFDDDVMLDVIDDDGVDVKKQKKDRSAKRSDNIEGKVIKGAGRKVEDKNTSKKVKIGEKIGERTWNDLKDAGVTDIEKGPFREEELKMLQDSIIEYCLMNNLDEEQLVELITSSSSEKYKNAWVEIAGVLPNRKVQSCHAVCKRKFNPNNYRGRWSDEEVDFLLDYVETKGRDWEKIGKLIGRTGLNVRDKFKELGEGNFANRTKTK